MHFLVYSKATRTRMDNFITYIESSVSQQNMINLPNDKQKIILFTENSIK